MKKWEIDKHKQRHLTVASFFSTNWPMTPLILVWAIWWEWHGTDRRVTALLLTSIGTQRGGAKCPLTKVEPNVTVHPWQRSVGLYTITSHHNVPDCGQLWTCWRVNYVCVQWLWSLILTVNDWQKDDDSDDNSKTENKSHVQTSHVASSRDRKQHTRRTSYTAFITHPGLTSLPPINNISLISLSVTSPCGGATPGPTRSFWPGRNRSALHGCPGRRKRPCVLLLSL